MPHVPSFLGTEVPAPWAFLLVLILMAISLAWYAADFKLEADNVRESRLAWELGRFGFRSHGPDWAQPRPWLPVSLSYRLRRALEMRLPNSFLVSPGRSGSVALRRSVFTDVFLSSVLRSFGSLSPLRGTSVWAGGGRQPTGIPVPLGTVCLGSWTTASPKGQPGQALRKAA